MANSLQTCKATRNCIKHLCSFCAWNCLFIDAFKYHCVYLWRKGTQFETPIADFRDVFGGLLDSQLHFRFAQSIDANGCSSWPHLRKQTWHSRHMDHAAYLPLCYCTVYLHCKFYVRQRGYVLKLHSVLEHVFFSFDRNWNFHNENCARVWKPWWQT